MIIAFLKYLLNSQFFDTDVNASKGTGLCMGGYFLVLNIHSFMFMWKVLNIHLDHVDDFKNGITLMYGTNMSIQAYMTDKNCP